MVVLVLVLADTHLRAGTVHKLPPAVLEAAGDAEAILHAGDVVEDAVLDLLSEAAPVYAVAGNNDVAMARSLPHTRRLVLGGVEVGMVHDAGAKSARGTRMHRAFPGCAVVVFGHSHVPENREGLGGQLLFNPGSPTYRRSQPHVTMGLLELSQGEVKRHDVVAI